MDYSCVRIEGRKLAAAPLFLFDFVAKRDQSHLRVGRVSAKSPSFRLRSAVGFPAKNARNGARSLRTMGNVHPSVPLNRVCALGM